MPLRREKEKMKTKIGKVVHYYRGIGVAVVALDWGLLEEDMITITKRHGRTNFNQIVKSMEINHKRIHEAVCGDTIGLKVKQRVRVKDSVYKELSVGEEQIIEDAVVLALDREELCDADAKLRAVRKHVAMFPSELTGGGGHPIHDYDGVNVWLEKLKKLVGVSV